MEAYRGNDDPASHSYRGLTKRNALMFGEPGMAYVYFSYGNHWCLNITTEGVGNPGAVLIRALEPLNGVEEMKGNRGVSATLQVASGPGKLTRALGIDGTMTGEDMVVSRRLYVLAGEFDGPIAATSRVGISRGLEHRWRFLASGSPFVSRARATTEPSKTSGSKKKGGVVG